MVLRLMARALIEEGTSFSTNDLATELKITQEEIENLLSTFNILLDVQADSDITEFRSPNQPQFKLYDFRTNTGKNYWGIQILQIQPNGYIKPIPLDVYVRSINPENLPNTITYIFNDGLLTISNSETAKRLNIPAKIEFSNKRLGTYGTYNLGSFFSMLPVILRSKKYETWARHVSSYENPGHRIQANALSLLRKHIQPKLINPQKQKFVETDDPIFDSLRFNGVSIHLNNTGMTIETGFTEIGHPEVTFSKPVLTLLRVYPNKEVTRETNPKMMLAVVVFDSDTNGLKWVPVEIKVQ